MYPAQIPAALFTGLSRVVGALLLVVFATAVQGADAVVAYEDGQILEALGRVVERDGRLLTQGSSFLELSPNTQAEAFKFVFDLKTRSLSLGPLDNRPTANTSSKALNSARDAEVSVGFADNGQFTPFHAFRQTPAGGLVDVGTLDPPNNANRSSFATSVSNDGSIVVGYSENDISIERAFRWAPGGGMVDLGTGAGNENFYQARAFGVSGDGSVIVGQSDFAVGFSTIRRAFRHTTTGGFQDLGGLEQFSVSIATEVTKDGTIVVGQSTVNALVNETVTNVGRAVRWTQAAGIQDLGVLSGHTYSVALAVSDDGNTVVGISSPSPLPNNTAGGRFTYGADARAFLWTPASGMQDLNQLLTTAGVSLDGQKILAATSVTPDGKWIGGAVTHAALAAGQTTPIFASLTAPPTLPGDYNGDGRVDAVDYTVWRNAGDTPERYLAWKQHFGASAVGGGAAQSVPEPASLLLMAGTGLVAVIAGRLRRHAD